MDRNKQLESFPIVFLNFESGCFTLFDDINEALKAGRSGFKNSEDYFILDTQNAVGLELKIEQLELECKDYRKAADFAVKENKQLEAERAKTEDNFTVIFDEQQEEIKQLKEALKYINLCASRRLQGEKNIDDPDMWVIKEESQKALEGK